MPPREWGFRLTDIIEAMERIDKYIQHLDLDTWLDDEKTIDAVIRNLEIIGEAASHLPNDIQEKYSDIPWKEIKGIRNLLAHEYFGVDNEIIWKTITNDLPLLKPLIKSIKPKMPDT
ncbi:MAG: DUF86 domain-containing protein [Gammaproteobacteria bacterium]|nr:MAG: DUF86 domain-containing protein [Gammaproteobacteria bacterium]